MKVEAVKRTNIQAQLNRQDDEDGAFKKYLDEAMKRKTFKK